MARVLCVHPDRDDVLLVRVAGGGTDYFLTCARHRWASPAVTRFQDLGVCPSCLAEMDAKRGRARYDALERERQGCGVKAAALVTHSA